MATREQKKKARREKRLAQENNRKKDRKDAGSVRAVLGPGTIQAQLPRKTLGPPGIPSELHVVAFQQAMAPDDGPARINDDREREFRVVVQLQTLIPLAAQNASISFDPTAGSSLLKVPRYELPKGGSVLVAVQTPAGVVRLHVNNKNEVSGAEFTCRGRSRAQALAIYDQHVAPVFDHISYKYDVPVNVASIAWFDSLNGVMGMNFIPSYAEVDASQLSGRYVEELRAFYGLYREALGNPSVFYQFLCHCKILEGAFRWKVPQLYKLARERGVELKAATPKVPQLDSMNTTAAVAAYQGKSIENAFTGFLEDEFRDAVAHFKTDDENPIEVTSYMATGRIGNVLELARVCARLAIEMLEAYISQLNQPAPTAGIGPTETPPTETVS